jgi:hypothetical protein
MSRVQQSIKFPLSKSAEDKVRAYYKSSNGLSKNSTMEIVYRSLGINNKKVAYNVMADLYNIKIEKDNTILRNKRLHDKQEKSKSKKTASAVKKENTEVTYILHLIMQLEYLKSFYEFEEEIRYPIGCTKIVEITTSPNTGLKENIRQVAYENESDDGYKRYTLISYKVVFMNTKKLIKNMKPKIKQRMRRSFVLANHWLKYSSKISKTAYEETNNKCVYHQLVNYLSDPPSNLPSDYVYFTDSKKQPLSEESLYRFFCEKIEEKGLQDDYENFTVDSGVSTELIALLCESLKRNM